MKQSGTALGYGKYADAISKTSSGDRKSTRLNSSHDQISYAVFCLKKKKTANALTPSLDFVRTNWCSRAALTGGVRTGRPTAGSTTRSISPSAYQVVPTV